MATANPVTTKSGSAHHGIPLHASQYRDPQAGIADAVRYGPIKTVVRIGRGVRAAVMSPRFAAGRIGHPAQAPLQSHGE